MTFRSAGVVKVRSRLANQTAAPAGQAGEGAKERHNGNPVLPFASRRTHSRLLPTRYAAFVSDLRAWDARGQVTGGFATGRGCCGPPALSRYGWGHPWNFGRTLAITRHARKMIHLKTARSFPDHFQFARGWHCSATVLTRGQIEPVFQ